MTSWYHGNSSSYNRQYRVPYSTHVKHDNSATLDQARSLIVMGMASTAVCKLSDHIQYSTLRLRWTCGLPVLFINCRELSPETTCDKTVSVLSTV